jgi:hypothetical protein
MLGANLDNAVLINTVSFTLSRNKWDNMLIGNAIVNKIK